MTNTELDVKIADTMATLRRDQLTKAIAFEYKAYQEELKEEAKKEKRKGESLARAMERLNDTSPCELYCYIMFDDAGDLRGWTIDHEQYWRGNSGPSSAIGLAHDVTYDDIAREIGNDLAEALDMDP